MKRMTKWFLMLNKRLYKKATFIAILVLIPICVFAFSIVSKQDSGFVNIVLAQTNTDDSISSQVIDELLNKDSIMQFTLAQSPDDALELVKTGQVDEAWIFADNVESKIDNFSTSEFDSEPVVTVVAREQNVFLRIANEKLSGTLYKHYAQAHYINFIRSNLSQLDSLSDDELMTYFDNISLDEDLFVFANPNGNSADSSPSTDYLSSPIRGLLAILVVLSGLAAAMYFMQDNKRGTFSWIRESNRIFIGFSCILIAVLNVTSVVLISLLCAGLSTMILKELLSLILYALCVSVFCLLLQQIFSDIKLYASLIPLLTVIMIAICPVFFDFRSVLWLQLIFPPTYYVNVVYDNMYLLYMLVYIIVGAVLCLLIEKLRGKIKSLR